MDKARKLMADKLSCLGCHRLGDEGGRIGPNLSNLKKNLQSEFVYEFIKNPQGILPETLMPKIAMPESTLALITNFLVQQEIATDNAEYLSLVENTPRFFGEDESGEGMYLRYCASCHGANGDGNGYNARFLPTKPTVHGDADYMEGRPDDTLFDGIFAGGFILNKSNRMPPWGQTLAYKDIRTLVEHLRRLCNCQGPKWSRDNKTTE